MYSFLLFSRDYTTLVNSLWFFKKVFIPISFKNTKGTETYSGRFAFAGTTGASRMRR